MPPHEVQRAHRTDVKDEKQRYEYEAKLATAAAAYSVHTRMHERRVCRTREPRAECRDKQKRRPRHIYDAHTPDIQPAHKRRGADEVPEPVSGRRAQEHPHAEKEIGRAHV